MKACLVLAEKKQIASGIRGSQRGSQEAFAEGPLRNPSPDPFPRLRQREDQRSPKVRGTRVRGCRAPSPKVRAEPWPGSRRVRSEPSGGSQGPFAEGVRRSCPQKRSSARKVRRRVSFAVFQEWLWLRIHGVKAKVPRCFKKLRFGKKQGRSPPLKRRNLKAGNYELGH